MCNCPRHGDAQADCECLCPAHENFALAYDLAMTRYHTITSLTAERDDLEAALARVRELHRDCPRRDDAPED